MKKAVLYTVLPALLATLAAGCGMAEPNDRFPTASPVISVSPGIPTPNTGNGVVNDRDGVITPGDNGTMTTPAATVKPEKAAPTASPSATPNI